MHSGCINAHDHITPNYQSIYQNLKGTFLQKMNECKHKKRTEGVKCRLRVAGGGLQVAGRRWQIRKKVLGC